MTLPIDSGRGGVPAARENKTLRKFSLRKLRLPIGANWRSFVVPDERAWLRDGTGTAGPPPRRGTRDWEPPYWMRVWPAAVGLARALARCDSLAGLRVLDLGCGLGVPGCQAAAQGADVTFLDREADALAFAVWNAESQHGGGRIDATVMDWSMATVGGNWDLILLSDVSYHHMHHPALKRQLSSGLASGGVALHSDPCREASTVFLEELSSEYSMWQHRSQQAVADERAEIRVTLMTRFGDSARLSTRLWSSIGRTSAPRTAHVRPVSR